jgi:diacylglycerol kinase
MMNNFGAYLRSFGYAFEGLLHAFKEHASFKVEVIAAVIVLFAGLMFRINRVEWMVLVLLIFSVLVAELLNTSIETALDYLAKEHHVDVKIAKDVAAGAVLILSIGAVVIGLLIFYPYVTNL